MTFNPTNLLLTLIGGLLLAALLGWIRKPRLIVLVPRLFSFSPLSVKGQLAEISIFNRGFKTEELIEVDLGGALSYEIVGANTKDIKLTNNKLLIQRIGPGDDVTALLLVENGAFTRGEISNCLSKESKGFIVSKLEDVSPTGPQRIGLVSVFVALPIIAYLGYSAFTTELNLVKKSATESATKSATESATKSATKSVISAKDLVEIRDWTTQEAYRTLAGPIFKGFEDNKIRIKVGKLVQKKDVTTVPISIENVSTLVVKASIKMDTQWSERKIPSYDRHVSDILIVPGAEVTKSMNVIVPLESPYATDKNIYMDVFFSEAGGDTLKLHRTYTVQLN